MKNKLTDLNDHLFLSLERLNEEGLTDKEIKKETARSRAVVAIADQIISGASVQLSAIELRQKMVRNMGAKNPRLPMLDDDYSGEK